MTKIKQRSKGQAIAETVAGIIVLVPLALFLLDVAVLVLANTANDALAKHAARAAANKDNAGAAQTSAANIVNDFKTSTIVTQKRLVSVLHDTGSGTVTVETSMNVRLPVPFPYLPTETTFQARAVEPIVALPPSDSAGALNAAS